MIIPNTYKKLSPCQLATWKQWLNAVDSQCLATVFVPSSKLNCTLNEKHKLRQNWSNTLNYLLRAGPGSGFVEERRCCEPVPNIIENKTYELSARRKHWEDTASICNTVTRHSVNLHQAPPPYCTESRFSDFQEQPRQTKSLFVQGWDVGLDCLAKKTLTCILTDVLSGGERGEWSVSHTDKKHNKKEKHKPIQDWNQARI